MQAEREVTAEVQRRLEAMGDDRTQWPPAARDECMRMDRKQQVKQPLGAWAWQG